MDSGSGDGPNDRNESGGRDVQRSPSSCLPFVSPLLCPLADLRNKEGDDDDDGNNVRTVTKTKDGDDYKTCVCACMSHQRFFWGVGVGVGANDGGATNSSHCNWRLHDFLFIGLIYDFSRQTEQTARIGQIYIFTVCIFYMLTQSDRCTSQVVSCRVVLVGRLKYEVDGMEKAATFVGRIGTWVTCIREYRLW